MTLVILSGSYIADEMTLEFGEIPPCMLPLGGKTLLEHQVNNFSGYKIYLTLPEKYELSGYQSNLISDLNVKVIRTKVDYSLGKAIDSALNYIEEEDDITILFGDTYIASDEYAKNSIGISKGIGYYAWSIYDKKENSLSNNCFQSRENLVFNGYLNVEDKISFLNVLSSLNNDLIGTLNKYLKTGVMKVAEMKKWLDFGHLNTYYSSKKGFSTEREFNQLIFEGEFVVKKSSNFDKLEAEFDWFNCLPDELKIYSPVVISNRKSDSGSYKVEYMNNLTLSELYQFSRLSDITWKQILTSCFDFLDNCSNMKHENVGDWRFEYKTIDRWRSLSLKTKKVILPYVEKYDLDIEAIIRHISKFCESLDFNTGVIIHGDFCFSNIFYDFRSQRIKVIDPRGCDFSGNSTAIGPAIYDYAKLAHSILGRYDDIVSGRYSMKDLNDNFELIFYDPDRNDYLKATYISMLENKGICLKSIYAQMILLFVSMIPLHQESSIRQLAFLVNAVNLYKEFKEI